MRLWSLHPRYLDPQGLVALWREALLAQKVLAGETKGYRNHPQLERFRRQADPMAAIGGYLEGVWEEARVRGYRFRREKIRVPGRARPLPVTEGQVAWELSHLRKKLETRRPGACALPDRAREIEPHPLFQTVPGDREDWERGDPEI